MPDTEQALTLGQMYASVRSGLADAGVPEAAISARHIVATAAGCGAADVIAAPRTPMTARMVAHADAMTARRAEGEPLQYVLGSWGFRKLDLATDRRALIPRPETESVAGFAIEWLAAQVRTGRLRAPNVADLGTGCGAIALSVAYEIPSARVFATDSSPDALALTSENMAGVGRAAARVSLHHGDWFGALVDVAVPASESWVPAAARASRPVGADALRPVGNPELRERLDAVIANPPYVAVDEELPDEVADWEPHDAVYAGLDGLADLHRILHEARGWLAPGGLLVLECAPHQAAELAAAAVARGYESVRVERDLAGRERALVAQRGFDEPAVTVIDAAAASLRDGGFVVAPTDTLCGVLARYGDNDAVAAVCSAKERPPTEPMPILVSGLAQAADLVELSCGARRLAGRHWPGGLTLVAKRLAGPDPLHGLHTLGVRAPALGWLRWLIDEVGPLTGTSANRHGATTPADAGEAAESLAVVPAAVIAGRAVAGTASTVVDVTGSEPVVLREGAVPAKLLMLDADQDHGVIALDSQGPKRPSG